jgi:hypothetical protein
MGFGIDFSAIIVYILTSGILVQGITLLIKFWGAKAAERVARAKVDSSMAGFLTRAEDRASKFETELEKVRSDLTMYKQNFTRLRADRDKYQATSNHWMKVAQELTMIAWDNAINIPKLPDR